MIIKSVNLLRIKFESREFEKAFPICFSLLLPSPSSSSLPLLPSFLIAHSFHVFSPKSGALREHEELLGALQWGFEVEPIESGAL